MVEDWVRFVVCRIGCNVSLLNCVGFINCVQDRPEFHIFLTLLRLSKAPNPLQRSCMDVSAMIVYVVERREVVLSDCSHYSNLASLTILLQISLLPQRALADYQILETTPNQRQQGAARKQLHVCRPLNWNFSRFLPRSIAEIGSVGIRTVGIYLTMCMYVGFRGRNAGFRKSKIS